MHVNAQTELLLKVCRTVLEMISPINDKSNDRKLIKLIFSVIYQEDGRTNIFKFRLLTKTICCSSSCLYHCKFDCLCFLDCFLDKSNYLKKWPLGACDVVFK